jgi:hypothetical protein
MAIPRWLSRNSVKCDGLSFFAKPALRTSYFLGDTALSFLVLVILAVTIIRYAHRLPALGLFLLGAVVFGLFSFWLAVFRVHSSIHELVASGVLKAPEPGSSTDKAFATVAALNFQSMLHASGLVGSCVMALVEILRQVERH